MKQKQLTPGRLLNKKGRLEQRGYATSLVREYRRQDIKASRLRIKEWDYYLICNERFGVAFTVADNGYMGLVSASFLDFTKGISQTKSPMSLFPLGRMKLPASSAAGETIYRGADCQFEFQTQNGERRLQVAIKNFDQGRPLRADLILRDEPPDSMVIATPFAGKPKAFYYNQKIVGMRAKGVVEYNGRPYYFQPEDSFGILDWGRGVWTYHNTWYWGAAAGVADGHDFGFNIGYGFGDTRAASENMLFYDGHAHKLEQVTLRIPVDQKGREEYLRPWRFTASDHRFKMDFLPLHDRASRTAVGPLLSDQHQVFGYFSGTAVLDDGTRVTVQKLLGFAERVENKW